MCYVVMLWASFTIAMLLVLIGRCSCYDVIVRVGSCIVLLMVLGLCCLVMRLCYELVLLCCAGVLLW